MKVTLRLLICALLAAAAGEEATAAKPTVDLTGIWMGVGNEAGAPYKNTPFPLPPPFTEEGRKQSLFWADPKNNQGARCLPGGGPAGVMNAGTFFPFEIIQRPEQVTLLFELMQQVRRVFLDGRKHPTGDDLENTWMGHSIGRWEGNTLVIDTVGTKRGALNGSGAAVIVFATDKDPRLPYSETMHLTERLTLLEGGKFLQAELTVDDPTLYTKPFTVKRYWQRSPDTPMLEYVCAENQRSKDEGYGHLEDDAAPK